VVDYGQPLLNLKYKLNIMQLSIFKYQSPEEQQLNDIRTVEIDGEIWFVGSDVTSILGYSNGRDAISRHCKPKGVVKHDIPTRSGNQSVTFISEPNLYRLISRSQLPSAEDFESWIFEEVLPSIRKKGFYGKIDRSQLPNFIIRYRDNFHKLPNDHFSVISEMFARLHIELEKVGYQIPDRAIDGKQMVPDISVGLGFAKYLQMNNSKFYNSHKTYTHSFPDGREVQANMYHIDALPDFIRYITQKWLPEHAQKYFKERDPLALDYLPKLLGSRV
jgi:prophage antirepressor-like protein